MAFVEVPGKSTLTFKDLKNNKSTMRVEKASGEATSAEVDALSTAISPFSACVVERKSALNGAFDAALVGNGNRDDKAVIVLQDEVGHIHKYAIPGYSGATEQDNEGLRVADAPLETIRAALQTFTGFTFVALRSPVVRTS